MVVDKLYGANGMTISSDRQNIFVNDLIVKV